MTCKVVKKKSKNGNEYICLEVQITPDYKKVVFLDGAETALIKQVYKEI